MAAYATTTVPVERSQGQIRTLLQQLGAEGFGFGEDTLGDVRYAVVSFRGGGRQVRMRVAMKLANEREVADKARRSRTKTAEQLRSEHSEQAAQNRAVSPVGGPSGTYLGRMRVRARRRV